MDISAPDKIEETEKQATLALEKEKAELEEKLSVEEKKCREDFEKFKDALSKEIAATKQKNTESMKKETSLIEARGRKKLGELDALSKKNMDNAVARFVKIAGNWHK